MQMRFELTLYIKALPKNLFHETVLLLSPWYAAHFPMLWS